MNKSKTTIIIAQLLTNGVSNYELLLKYLEHQPISSNEILNKKIANACNSNPFRGTTTKNQFKETLPQ